METNTKPAPTSKYPLGKAVEVMSGKIQELAGIFRTIVSQQLSHDATMPLIQSRIRNGSSWERLPIWAKNKIEGAIQGHYDAMHVHAIEWRIYDKNKKLITSDEVKDWSKCQGGAHVYIANPAAVWSDGFREPGK